MLIGLIALYFTAMKQLDTAIWNMNKSYLSVEETNRVLKIDMPALLRQNDTVCKVFHRFPNPHKENIFVTLYTSTLKGTHYHQSFSTPVSHIECN